ncbi:uncharacterized protein K452DRAFT_116531 [Aplosporella prunicola CBS 121167]|uniref:Uncharacterized protein n=1 Tax=Aplosporella prunicola CBS 121167 TaxID=1176127 RepID=A0A6A6B0X6_9PEZI|nr:uncharacterized protein K452DRAFT_116531 [Aplosporella prunicola CBS 121167]KAF2136874.1 hypothetical protein K452DRAFT_116531 [Aplosporella prunicola CBS 121167]
MCVCGGGVGVRRRRRSGTTWVGLGGFVYAIPAAWAAYFLLCLHFSFNFRCVEHMLPTTYYYGKRDGLNKKELSFLLINEFISHAALGFSPLPSYTHTHAPNQSSTHAVLPPSYSLTQEKEKPRAKPKQKETTPARATAPEIASQVADPDPGS